MLSARKRLRGCHHVQVRGLHRGFGEKMKRRSGKTMRAENRKKRVIACVGVILGSGLTQKKITW